VTLGSGRGLAAVLAAAAAAVALATRGFVTSFPTDPLGPRAFPLLSAALLLIAALGVARRPGPPPPWPERATLRRQAVMVALLGSYALLVGPIGFLPTTTLVLAGLARLFGARTLPGVLAAVLMTAGLWALFGLVLGMPLPVGSLFSGSP
jgi:putative tricarboxylic transport membrane protein